MANFRSQDNALLNESYDVILLKENAHLLTLEQLRANVDILSEAEAEYICTVTERFLNEGIGSFFSGAKNVAQGIGGAAKNAAAGIGGAAKGAASAVGQKVGQVGSGLAAAGSQALQQGKDAYNTGVTSAEFSKFQPKAKQMVDQLISMLTQAQQKGILQFKGDVTKVNLKTVADKILAAQQGAQQQSATARQGLGSGLGAAFKQGYQGQA